MLYVYLKAAFIAAVARLNVNCTNTSHKLDKGVAGNMVCRLQQ